MPTSSPMILITSSTSSNAIPLAVIIGAVVAA